MTATRLRAWICIYWVFGAAVGCSQSPPVKYETLLSNSTSSIVHYWADSLAERPEWTVFDRCKWKYPSTIIAFSDENVGVHSFTWFSEQFNLDIKPISALSGECPEWKTPASLIVSPWPENLFHFFNEGVQVAWEALISTGHIKTTAELDCGDRGIQTASDASTMLFPLEGEHHAVDDTQFLWSWVSADVRSFPDVVGQNGACFSQVVVPHRNKSFYVTNETDLR
jgi:hypothetical protein